MKGIENINGHFAFDGTEITSDSLNSKGLEVEEGAARKLKYNGVDVAVGTSDKKGFYVDEISGNRILKFDGATLAKKTDTGGDIGGDTGSYISPEGYWIPVAQPNGVVEKDQSYETLIGKYDALMAAHPGYITKRTSPLVTDSGGYALHSYVFVPQSYTKTFFVGCTVHGNEKDAPIQLYRIAEILCNKTHLPEYAELAKLRNNVRLILVPIISPYGYNNSSMNVPYPGAQYGINMNRNYDFNHQYSIPSVGVGGNSPFEMEEIQHVRDIISEFGAENIDFYMDMHDGGNVNEHYWINYNVDHPNRNPVKDFVQYLIEKYNISNPIIPHVADNGITGMAQTWAAKSMGIVASTNEWIGGFLGYDFSSSQMTQSMEIRANILLMAYNQNWKGNIVNIESTFFHIDKGKAFTRKSLRKEGASAETLVSDSEIYARWDSLMAKYPTRITKSASLGTNPEGLSIHTYTIGNGANKVLYVGGVMRYGGTHKIDEYAIWQLAEYLCQDHFVNQSAHLQNLRNNYTIIVLPFIDNVAGNTENDKKKGLNNTVITSPKWQITNGKTVPSSWGLTVHDVPIIKNLIDSNENLKMIVSGGEIMEGYSLNPADYSTNFETQFVIPKNQIWDFESYRTHLQTNRVENVVVENTKGLTFGDYAYDQYGIKTYFIQVKSHAARWAEVSSEMDISADDYLYHNWNAGRRIANIVNVFLTA